MKRSTLVLGGLAVASTGTALVLLLALGAEQRRLEAEWNTSQSALTAAQAELQAAGERAGVLSRHTATLESELAQAKSRLEAAEARALGLARDLDEQRTIAARHEAGEQQLRTEYDALTEELVQTRLNTAAAASSTELDEYRQKVTALEAQVAALESADARPPEPRPPPALVQVLSVGPENAFVVLDFGSDWGAAEKQVLLVRRGSVPLATVAITSAHPRHAIAHVLPDSLQGSLRPGDAAILLD